MAFDGAWKNHRNENYDKFMEQMGKGPSPSGSFLLLSVLTPAKALLWR